MIETNCVVFKEECSDELRIGNEFQLKDSGLFI